MSDVFQDYGSSFKSESKPRDPKFDQFDDSQSLVHLHVHTEHSFLDGVPKVPQLVDRVTDLGQWAVAITDHGEMSGHLRLQRACQEAEVKPIFGMEGYFTDDRFVKEGKKGENYQHITLLAYSYQGLQNLWALGSLGHIEGQYYGDPRIDWDLLSKYSEGIIATGGCMGGCVARFLHREGKHYDPERAVERIGRFLDVFGDNFYLEIHSFDSPEHRVLNQDLVRVAREFSVPLIGVSDSHYAHPDDWKDHELLAQPLTSLVLTPTGWVKMGDLEKGEEVVGSDGRPTEILGINPRGIQEVYEVTFDDGTRVRSTKDHLWTVYGDAFSDRRRTTVPLSYIIERPHKTFNVPLVDPIEGQEQTFVIDPYLMGALLGDGHFNDSGNVILACSETEILDLCELPEGCSWKDYRDDSYGLIGTGHKNPALQEIRDLGLIDSRARTKYIPPRYLEGSVVQRLRLLQGLMDTDGSVGQDGSVEFGTISPRLAEDVATLVRSLGGSAKVSHYTTQTPIYMVSIRRVYQTWCPFSLARKANRHTQIKTSRTVPRTRGKAIRTIEKVSEEPVQCIMVSNEDGLYVTDDYTLTHNTAVQMGRTMDDPDRFQYGPHQLSVISEMEWRSRLDYLPEGVVDECMTNTTQIAKQANVTIPTETKMPVYFDTIEDDNEYMTRKAWEGFEEKIPRLLNQSMPPTKLDGTPYTEEDYRERLEYELGVVLDKGYSGYFIEVADIVRAAKEEGQLVGPARGSAGGALLSFVLGITEVEPMRAGLIFERFLDPGRVSLPDIDIDFPQHLRERSKTRLKEKYGEHSTATIGTLNTLKPKQALRDFCRGLNIPRGDTEKMSAVIDRTGLSGAPSWDWEEVNSRHRKEFAPWVKKYPYLFQLMDKFSTHIRHAGAHAAGVVVSHESLIGRLPLRYKNGELRTMFDMKDVEAVGLVKIDFLGLRNLSTIMACMDILKETKDPQDLPLHPYEWAYNWEEYYEDPKVWEQIRTGKNIGAFQIETSDLRRLTLEFQPENLQDLCDMISVFRPGITRSVDPDTGMNLLDLYLAKRKGEREVTFPHENLEPVLGVTHGQFVYQEQIMKACTVLAGYTLQETDRVRKILGKMLQEEMKKERVVFVKGCQEHSDIHPSLANQIFNTMETFGTYGYNQCCGPTTQVVLPTGERETIAWLYRNQETVPEIMSMWPDGTIRPHTIERVVKSGKKMTYRVQAHGKYVFYGTEDHRLLTTRGYVRIRDIVPGEDELIVDESRLSERAIKARSENMKKLWDRPEMSKWVEESSSRMVQYHKDHPELAQGSRERMWRANREFWAEDGPLQEQRREEVRERFRKLHQDPKWRRDWLQAVEASRHPLVNGQGLRTQLSDGRWCDSREEARVGEYLLSRGLDFELHKYLKNGRGITDFYFEGMYWEYDGMVRSPHVFEDKYQDLPFVVLYPWDWKAKVDEYLQASHVSNGALVQSITSHKVEMTYDIEMGDSGPSNFIGNGVVSHNSHGWAYAMIAYWTAWYKTHYPHEYMTALFRTNQSRSPLFARECKRMNISILGPDVNESKELFTLTEDGTIRYGLSTVKYLSGGADEVVRNAPFSSMKDFVDRVPKKKCNKRAVVSAILVGTFDSIAGNDGWQERYEGWSPTRIALDEYWEARKDWKDRHLTTLEVSQDEKLKKKHKPRTASENFTLFDEYCEDLQLDVRAKHEQEILGTLVDADPLGDYMDLILKEDTFPGEFEMMLGEKCRLGGIVTTVKNLTTKRGKNPGQAMAQVWIEPASVVANEDGDEEVREALQVVMFPDAWSQFKNSVQLGSPVLADLEKIEGGLSCYRIFKLDDMKG